MLSYACKVTRSLPRAAVAAAAPTSLLSTPHGNGAPVNHVPFQLLQQQQMQQHQQLRWKHSRRQIKRLFKEHPAIIRVENRLGIDRTPAPMPPPTFEAVFEPNFLPNGWSAPPGPDVALPDYPFQVTRTKDKPNDAAGFLPVYSTYRKDGSAGTVRVKKVTGDRDLFVRELRSVLALPPPKNGNPLMDPIRIRVGGTIEVKGGRSREIKRWLAGLGF